MDLAVPNNWEAGQGVTRGFAGTVFLLIWVSAVVISVMAANSVVSVVEEVDQEQVDLEKELKALKHEHRMLQEWVVQEFRPWVDRQIHRQADAQPKDVPVDPLPKLPEPPSPEPVPTPEPVPVPEPPSPSVPPVPSPTCIPLICV